MDHKERPPRLAWTRPQTSNLNPSPFFCIFKIACFNASDAGRLPLSYNGGPTNVQAHLHGRVNLSCILCSLLLLFE